MALPGAGELPWRLGATWLPADLPAGGQRLEPSGSPELRVRAHLFDQPDRGDFGEAPWRPEALLATVAFADGTEVTDGILATVADGLALQFGSDAGSAVTRRTATGGAVVLTRPDAQDGLGDLLADREQAAGSFVEPPGSDWGTAEVPVDWVPGLAPTVGTRYAAAGGDRSVEVTTTAGTLPDIGSLTGLTAGAPVPLDTIDAWSSAPTGSRERLVTWQAAPGVVGQVRATGLSNAELLRVVANARVVGAVAPLGDPAARVVLRSAGDVDYQVQWVPRIGTDPDPCLVVVVEGIVDGPECGDESQPLHVFRSFGPIARTPDVTVVFGVFAADVASVSFDDPALGEVATVAVHPEDPSTSLRVAVLLLMRRGGPPVAVTLRHADGSPVEEQDVNGYPLGHLTIDPESDIGG